MRGVRAVTGVAADIRAHPVVGAERRPAGFVAGTRLPHRLPPSARHVLTQRMERIRANTYETVVGIRDGATNGPAGTVRGAAAGLQTFGLSTVVQNNAHVVVRALHAAALARRRAPRTVTALICLSVAVVVDPVATVVRLLAPRAHAIQAERVGRALVCGMALARASPRVPITVDPVTATRRDQLGDEHRKHKTQVSGHQKLPPKRNPGP